MTPEILESIRQFDTCTIANAIERFGVAPKVAAVAAQIAASERRIIEVCQSAGFSPQKLREAIQSNS